MKKLDSSNIVCGYLESPKLKDKIIVKFGELKINTEKKKAESLKYSFMMFVTSE